MYNNASMHSFYVTCTCIYIFSENSPPVFKGGSTFRVVLGQESVYNFTVTDDSDNFTVTAVGDLGNSSISFTNDSNGNFSFRVTMHEPTIFTLTFVAQDSIAAASLDPIVELCGCTNGGNCTLQGLLQTEFTTTIMNCECPEGI